MFSKKPPEIVLPDGEETAGFGVMLSDLIKENLERNPRKVIPFNLLNRLKSKVVIEAPDAEVIITLSFGDGRLIVKNGADPKAKVRIIANSDVILELSGIRLVAGLPWIWDEAGKSLVQRMFKREMKVRGIADRPITMLFLTNLVSAK
ncbi:MAG: hypothetical protein PHE84_02835 [bacterium]|nr:hypothetical protein [bacterium]